MKIKDLKKMLLIPLETKVIILSWENDEFLKPYQNSLDYECDHEIDELELIEVVEPVALHIEDNEVVIWIK